MITSRGPFALEPALGLGLATVRRSRAGQHQGDAAAPFSEHRLPTPDAPSQVTVHDLHKHFGARSVLDGVSLSIAPGEFVAIVGRSGCGKSTLLRLIAGLEHADASQPLAIQIDSKAASEPQFGTRIMFQDARLLPWKSVIENVALGLQRTQRRRAEEALQQVGLADRAGDWPAPLSGGQKQRVALARALAHQPRLLLLDEPLGALDSLTRMDMQSLIESIWLRVRFTALLVTHDMSEAIALADRVLVMQDGRIAHDVRVTLERPRRRRSPEFSALVASLLDHVLAAP